MLLQVGSQYTAISFMEVHTHTHLCVCGLVGVCVGVHVCVMMVWGAECLSVHAGMFLVKVVGNLLFLTTRLSLVNTNAAFQPELNETPMSITVTDFSYRRWNSWQSESPFCPARPSAECQDSPSGSLVCFALSTQQKDKPKTSFTDSSSNMPVALMSHGVSKALSEATFQS